MDFPGADRIIPAAGAPVRIPPPGAADILDLEGSHHDYCPHSYRRHHVFRAGAERLSEEGRDAAHRRLINAAVVQRFLCAAIIFQTKKHILGMINHLHHITY